MALETLNNRYGIRHFDEGGTTNDPIAGLYSSVLGRAPDAAGLAYWQGALASGQTLGDITSSFQNSQEAQARAATTPSGGNVTVQSAGSQYDNAQPINQTVTGPLYTTLPGTNYGVQYQAQPAPAPSYGSTDAITDWYETNLGRKPDQTGLDFWSKSFGDTLDPNEITQLQQSPEYTNRQAVSNFYDTELGRKAAEDKAGLDYWAGLANTGTSLDDIRLGISGSSEGQTFDLNNLYKTEFGRAPDAPGAEYWQSQLNSGKSIEDIQKAFNESKEGVGFDISNLYENVLGRKPDELGLKFWLDAIDKGVPREEILNSFQQAPEYQVAEDYQKYLGRAPEGAGSQYYQEQLASGRDPREIEREIAWSQESLGANSPSVKSVLEATLGTNVVAGLSPEQLSEYTKLILDPSRISQTSPVNQADFNVEYYLAQNPDVAASGLDPYQHYKQYGFNEGRAANDVAPTYATQDDNLREVYKQIALDPVMGEKLRAENPMLWEQLTPLTHRPDEYARTERTGYGQYGVVDIEGVNVPILNGQRVDQLFGDELSGTISDFSHGRGNLTRDLGWSSNSFSGKIAKGADALGVTKYETEYGNDYTGLNEAADLLGIDASQFKDKQVQATTTEQRDEYGNVVQQGGQPAFNVDEYGNSTPVMKTITAQDQLYDAIGKAAKDIYSYTGDSLTPGQGSEGGAKSFDTVMYKRTGDELIPISKPVSHGGMQNFDVYNPQDNGLSTALTMAVAVAAVAVAPQLSAYLVTSMGVGTATAAVMTGVIVGAGVGATNATIAGKSVGEAALKGGAIGGVTAGVTTGLAEGLSSAFPPTVLADGTKVANSVFSGASELMGGAISPAGVQSVVTQTLARTLTTGVTPGANGDKILNAFGTALVSSGLSVAASEQIVSQMTEAGLDKDNIAKLARTVQLAVNTGSTAALSGKSSDQVLQSIISGVIAGGPSIAKAKGDPPAIEPTNPFGTENVGFVSGSVDKVLQSQIMDGIANNTDDPIAFLQAAKNWTGDGSKNVEFVTTEMVRQGIPADQISADLQELYRIPENKANEYATYMASKNAPSATTVNNNNKLTTTAGQQPVATVATQNVAPVTAPSPDPYANQLFGSMVEAFSNPSALGPAYAPLAQALPVSRYDVGSSSPLVTSGATQSNLGGASPANDPTSYRTYSPRPSVDEYSNAYPSVTGRAAQDPNYIRELVEAYKADPSYAPIREELQKLDPNNAVFVNVENADVARAESPTTNKIPPLYSGKQVSVTGYPELSALPKPVEPPMPMPEPRPQPEPMPATPSPNEPANDPFILPEPLVPGRRITPIVPVSPPGALPTIAPSQIPLQDPNAIPTPKISPVSPPGEQPITPATPKTPTGPVQEPVGEPEKKPTPKQQSAIQQVAKNPQDAKRLELAVPRVTQLILQGVPKPVAIPRVVTETGAPIQELTEIIDATVPVIETPTVTPPTVNPPAPPKTPSTKAPTTTTGGGGYGIISPFLIQQYGGIKDLAPGLTEGGNYSLSGIPNTDLNMNPMTPNFPLQQFASTSLQSPLELGDENQDQTPLQMATGGMVSQQQAYNPYDVSSGISGSLTPGLTKARLDYILTGLPQSHAEGGTIVGHNPQFFSEGGLGSMDNTFVKGEGDGTSDQVPAMLANGEFVIPADIVSGLGNGSNDAGAQVLQEFLKVIRDHKHSAKSDKLPPESKGPLAYLTNAKRKVKVA